MSGFPPSYFSVEGDNLDHTRVKLALGTQEHEFILRLPRAALTDKRKREMINAWALGIYTCPYANISHRTVEELLDHLESEFPLERTLFPRPKFRMW